MTRFIAFLIAAFAAYTPLAAETIITGNHAAIVLDGDSGPFRVTSPAQIGRLTAHNAADVLIDSGSFANIELYGDALRFVGGTTYGPDPLLFAHSGTVTLDVIDVAAGTPDAVASLNASGTRARLYARLLNGDVLDITAARPAHDGPRPTFALEYHDLPIDLDGDGLIGIGELNAVRENYGTIFPAADFDLSRTYIDFADLNIVRNNFGSAYYPRGATAVSEPPTFLLIPVAAICFALFQIAAASRRRR